MDTVEFALACYRAPLAYQAQLALAAPLPEDMERLLRLASGSPEILEAATRQTSAKPEELQEAARFCVQQLCFARDADCYRVLGVNPGTPLERIKEHHRLLMRLFHPDRAASRESWTDHYATRVNEAWTTLSRSPAPPEVLHESWPPQPVTPQPAPNLRPWPQHRFASPKAHFNRRVQWAPMLVLGGLALTVALTLGALYLSRDGANSTGLATADVPVWESNRVGATAATPAQDANLNSFWAAPDWQALERREETMRQQAAQAQAVRHQLDERRQEQLAVEEEVMKRLRAERLQLEQQLQADQAQAVRLWSERARVEQARLEQLKAEQARLEQAKVERLAAEQQRLQALRAEQARMEQLAAELRAERARLEALKAEQAPPAQEQVDPARQKRLQQQAAQRQAEQARLEQTRLERLRLEEQLKVERAKVERARLEEERRRAERARRDQAARLAEPPAEKPRKAEAAALNPTAAPDRVSAEVVLTIRELDELMGRYTRAYERGDVNGILALFAENARSGRDRVRRDYSAFFAKNDIRQLSLRLHWNPQGASASGAGCYELEMQQRDSGKVQQAGGAIRFNVRKQDGRALIDAIDYD